MNYLEISEKVEKLLLGSSAPVVCTDVSADDFPGVTGERILSFVGEPNVVLAANMPEPLKSMPSYVDKGRGALDHLALVKGSTGAVVYYYDLSGGTSLYDLSNLNCSPDGLLENIKMYVDSWLVPDFVDPSSVVAH